MRFRSGLVVGTAVGYYLGSMAGRERYEQLNRVLNRARQSETLDNVGDKAKAVIDLTMERARDLVESKIGGNGSGPVLSDS